MQPTVDNLRSALFKPVDAASVALFRIGFGFIMLLDSVEHLFFVDLHSHYVAPKIFFRFYGFEWVPILRENVYAIYAVMAIASLGIMFGKYYRTSVAIVGIGTAWVFFQEQSRYLNHVYMLILYCLIMFAIPANRYWSLDAKDSPGIARNTLPAWCRLMLIIQIEAILIWAGIVKLNPDWLQLEPLAHWLARRDDMPLFGALFVNPGAVAVASYGVTALHLIGAPLLLFKKTRFYILGMYACFHFLNHFVFDIGVFPWVTFFASLICFEADWPRAFWSRLRRQSYVPPPLDEISLPTVNKQWVISTLLATWLVFQIGMPMRNWFYDGWVAWNEQGHRYSWRMKLRSKSGQAVFTVYDPATDKSYTINPDRYLNKRQRFKMQCQPDMLLQMAHFIRDYFAPNGQRIKNAQVYVNAPCSLNFRKPQQLIDRRADLAKVERTLTGNDWITRLEEPLVAETWWSLVGRPDSLAEKTADP
jgi:hypothetical protein